MRVLEKQGDVDKLLLLLNLLTRLCGLPTFSPSGRSSGIGMALMTLHVTACPSWMHCLVPEVGFGLLTLGHWHQALRNSKSPTMCGTGNWAIPELKMLRDSLVSIPLDIFNVIETTALPWPVQLSKWLWLSFEKPSLIPQIGPF